MKVFHLPDLGEGLAEAEIRQWYVQKGDDVKVDQPLVSMETAKAVVDVPSPYAGKIIELHGKANEIVKTGAPLITFETNSASQDKGSVVGALEQSSKKWDESAVIIGGAKSKSQNIKAMPAARILAREMNIDLSLVKPTGPQGLITPNDVKQMMSHKPQTSALTGETEALHGVRRVMAQAMAASHKEVVPVTIVEDVDISDLPKGSDVTVALIQAIIAGVKAEPSVNVWFDGKTLERKLFKEINIGLAVDTPEGLFVPVIKDAEKKSPTEIREIVDKYKKTAQDRSIPASDMQGATITLSNFGMIAGQYATPIIVPPAVAIVGCGRSREVPMVRNGEIKIGKVLPLSLTFDHRAMTGGEATRFLGAMIKSLQGK